MEEHKKKIPSSHVAEHVSYFTKRNGESGEFDWESIKAAHDKLGITKGVPIKCRAIMNMISDRKEKPTVDVLCKYNNPARTGLWNAEGTFDQKQFDALVSKYAQKNALGQQVISLSDLKTFLEQEHKGETLGNATHIFRVIPVSWQAVTNGSVTELLTYFSDTWVEETTDSSKRTQAITVEHLKRWYTDNLSVLNMREDKKLPVSEQDYVAALVQGSA